MSNGWNMELFTNYRKTIPITKCNILHDIIHVYIGNVIIMSI